MLLSSGFGFRAVVPGSSRILALLPIPGPSGKAVSQFEGIVSPEDWFATMSVA